MGCDPVVVWGGGEPANEPPARHGALPGSDSLLPVGRGVAPNCTYSLHIATLIASVRRISPKGKVRKMDISKLNTGMKLVLGATIAFLVVSIFNWQEVDLGIVSAGVSMWHGWGVLAGLLAIGILVWEGLRIANVKLEFGLTPAMVTAGLAVLVLVFTILKFLVNNEFRTFWAWLGLLLAILIAVGAWMNMQAMGDSVAEMRTSMKAAAGSAAAAARSATDKPAAPPSPAAPPPPPAPPSPPAPDAPVAGAYTESAPVSGEPDEHQPPPATA